MTTQSLPEYMKAQVLEEYNEPYVHKDLPVPKITTDHDLLIKVDAASYCHTDAVLSSGQMRPNPQSFPHIGSHEFAGTVIALPHTPSDIAKNYSIGTRLGIPGRAFHPCGSCFECKDPDNDYIGYSNYCVNAGNNGISKAGGFSQYAVVDARQVAPLPDKLRALDAAPLMCAGITIFNALKRCNLAPGQRLAMIGAGGGLGHLGLQFAEAVGLRTIGVDVADGPLKLARSLGTKAEIVDARVTKAEDIVKQVGKEDKKTEWPDMGLDAVIILPESQASFDYGVKLLRNHGLCVVVSFPEQGFHVSARNLVFRDISVVGSLLGSNSILREMVAFAAVLNMPGSTGFWLGSGSVQPLIGWFSTVLELY